ncbi:hypothetical protein BH24ACT3_BH24ACT3_07850 [soil metagenome]
MDQRAVEVYERRAAEWVRRRGPRGLHRAQAFGRRARADDGPVVALGCGSGWSTVALGAPAVALDAARSMLELAGETAPDALRVQADLEALPFRTGALGAGFAMASYVHVPRSRMPLALADLHRSLAVGSPVELLVFRGDQEHGGLDGDDFPDRRFSLWPEDELVDVLVGAGFDIDEFEALPDGDGRGRIRVVATRARTLADTIGPGMRLLVCGLNPSLYAADAGVGFARPGNRFWPALCAAWLSSVDRDPRGLLTLHGIGMTDLVKRATVAASELTTAEYRHGLARVERLCARLRPATMCFVGLAGWRAAVDRHAAAGEQPGRLARTPVYVMPSTSGLNAHATPAQLTAHLRAAATLAAMSDGK